MTEEVKTENVEQVVTTITATKTEPTTEAQGIWIKDAQVQFLKLWSVRFSLGLSLMASIQAGIAVWDGTNPWPAVATVVMGIVIAVTRVVRQPKVSASGGFEIDISTATTTVTKDPNA